MKMVKIYRLFELILPRFETKNQSDEAHLKLQNKALNDTLEKWINQQVYFDYPSSANATIQLEKLKHYLKHYPKFQQVDQVELAITDVPQIDFLPTVLLAEYLGILQLKSFVYRHVDDVTIDKNNFVERDVYMEFVVSILDTDIELEKTVQPEKEKPQSYEKNYTTVSHKIPSGELLEARFDSRGTLQGVSFNKRPLLVQKGGLRKKDLNVLALLIERKGGLVLNDTLKESCEIKDSAELDRTFNRLKKVGIPIQTENEQGRFLS